MVAHQVADHDHDANPARGVDDPVPTAEGAAVSTDVLDQRRDAGCVVGVLCASTSSVVGVTSPVSYPCIRATAGDHTQR